MYTPFSQFWILVLMVCVRIGDGEYLDLATVFKFNDERDPPTYATMEFHTQTNALGIIMKTKNNSYIDPVVGTTPLHCTPADSSCKWERTGDWNYKVSKYPLVYQSKFLPQIESIYSSHCSKTSDNCHFYCNVDRNMCQCPTENYDLDYDGICVPNGKGHHVSNEGIGTLSSSDSDIKSLLIIAPPNSVVWLRMTGSTSCSITVYEYSSFGLENEETYRCSYVNNEVINTNYRRVLVTVSEDSDYYSDWEMITIEYGFIEKFLSLTSGSGTLSYSFPVSTSIVCLSVTYSSLSNTTEIMVYAETGIQNEIFTKFCREMNEEATYCRFNLRTPPEAKGSALNVSIHVDGETILYNVAQCSPYGNVDVSAVGKVSINHINTVVRNVVWHKGIWNWDSWDSNRMKCINGGVEHKQECQCPAGFHGKRCEKGCGPNRYGNNCEGVCSTFGRKCRGMLFCKDHLPCLCAPGFNGTYCEKPCTPGSYGASCKNDCGKCANGTCDVFTGMCDGDCLPGYYPPLCQETYSYMTSAPKVVYRDMNVVTVAVDSVPVGQGDMKFYQLQYKEKESSLWIKIEPESSSTFHAANITEFTPGSLYEVRIICLDATGNSYDGPLVAVGEFVAPCNETVPSYELKAETGETTVNVTWKIKQSPNSCHLKEYEILVRRLWEERRKIVPDPERHGVIENLLPGQTYDVAIRGQGNFGWTQFSAPITVTTKEKDVSDVRELSATSESSTSLNVSWKSPLDSKNWFKFYVVKYECVRLLACNMSCNHSKGVVHVKEESIILKNLIPHAQYKIEVAVQAESLGRFRRVYMTTDSAEPQVAPDSVATSIIFRNNVSFAVQWKFPENCSRMNGYFRFFRYELRTDESEEVLELGTTKFENMTYHNLRPLTQYYVYIYVVATVGWNPLVNLVIPVKTTSPVPEAVRDLSIYKKGRNMIGLRWAPPARSYGVLQTFVISYKQLGNKNQEVNVVKPEHCVSWPEMYCSTINRLLPNKQYQIEVFARNENVDVNGEVRRISTKTKEEAPGAPDKLVLEERTPTELVVKWRSPFMVNGVLRSFLVNVEHIDALDMDLCCNNFPVTEIPVLEETQEYTNKITDLLPASTYVVSVSAKTVTLGPSTNITVSIPPQIPRLQKAPEILNIDDFSSDTPLRVRLHGTDSLLHEGLKSKYLLLVIGDIDLPGDQIIDHDLEDQIDKLIRTNVGHFNYYIVSEIMPDELLRDVLVGTDKLSLQGTWSNLQDPKLKPGTYRLALALVLEYAEAKSVGFVATDPFSVGFKDESTPPYDE